MKKINYKNAVHHKRKQDPPKFMELEFPETMTMHPRDKMEIPLLCTTCFTEFFINIDGCPECGSQAIYKREK